MSKKNNHKVINGMYKGQIADIPPEKIREVLSKCN